MATRTVPINITTRTNKARYTQGGTAELVNCYVEQIGEEGKVTEYVTASDGLQGFARMPGVTGAIRDMIEVDGQVYIVAGTSARVFRLTSNQNVTDIGALSGFDTTGPVYSARNRRSTPDVAFNNNGLLYNYRTSLAQVTDADLLAPQSLTVNDGQFAIATVDNKYQVGEIDDGTSWDGLSVERGDASPDSNVRIYARQGQLLLFGQVTCEILNNAGLADGTGYERTQVIEFGCLAAKSVATVGGFVCWVAHDRTVRALDGYTPVEISDTFICREIQRVADFTSIRGFSWVRDGHSWYTLSCPEWTYSFNMKTRRWNTRKTYVQSYWNVGTAVSAFGKTLVGSSTEPIVYEMGPQFFSDAGQPLVSQMTFSPLVVPGKKISVSKVWWDLERGVGTGQGDAEDINPQAMLEWSLDGGATFGGSRLLNLGAQGQRTNELETRRLGQCKGLGFVFRLTVSAQVAKAVYQGQAEIEVND